tara:strand:+ start:5081 stop:6325 length:1245 start_codon:yes stop_codon:yes gene_type:complete
MNIKHRQTCRICGNKHLTDVIDLGEQFFQGSFVKDGVPDPPTRKTPNKIVRCDTSQDENACGLVQTSCSVPPEILYTNYWYQSGISQTMKDHLRGIVEEALSITKLSKGRVLDIASNDNTLLRNYPNSFKKWGIDPSDIARKQTDADITVVNDTFPTKDLSCETTFDIITSIACYYDVEDPTAFAIDIKNRLTNDGIWIFEVAYWPSMLDNLAYDSIVNEHIIHYHLAPLETMLRSVGLKVFNAVKTATNGGSIKVHVCHQGCCTYDEDESKKALNKLRMEEFEAHLDDDSTYTSFRERVECQKQELLALISSIQEEGKTIHIYGASTKLNTILGYCDIGPEIIKYAAERSPEKWGAKTISGIELISEEESRAMKPDYYLVGPYHFKKEILEREKEALAQGTKFIFPLPHLSVE